MASAPIIDVGTPPVDVLRCGEEGHVVVYFHDVQNLDKTRGSFVESSPFYCIGHQWKLRFYPGGSDSSNRNLRDRLCSVGIVYCSDSKVTVNVQLDAGIKMGNRLNLGTFNFQATSDKPYVSDTIPASYIRGAETFMVNVYITDQSSLYMQPKRVESMLAIFGDIETSDIAFQTKDAVVYGHRVILKMHVPYLYDLSETYDVDNPLPIPDVDSRIFRAMLSTLYGNNMMADDWTGDLKCILKAADKYGFPDLKVQADKWYVKATTLTADNVIQELLYADGSGHALMKKTAIDFIVNNTNEVLSSDAFEELHKSLSLLKEVMSAMSRT
jgi:hypothetical protein